MVVGGHHGAGVDALRVSDDFVQGLLVKALADFVETWAEFSAGPVKLMAPFAPQGADQLAAFGFIFFSHHTRCGKGQGGSTGDGCSGFFYIHDFLTPFRGILLRQSAMQLSSQSIPDVTRNAMLPKFKEVLKS
jgi:hypothetical protein